MPPLPGGSDYYMVIALHQVEQGVLTAASVFVATGNSEEEAVAKVATTNPDAVLFTAQVVPTFPPPVQEV